MVKPIILANSITAVSLVLYVACRVLSLIAPDFLFNIGRSWFHTFSLDALRGNTPMDAGAFVFGAITLAILTWITTYAAAALYSKWSK